MYKTVLSADTLAGRLDDPQWVIFDCRFQLDDPGWGEGEYRRSHIPGAVYAHLDRVLSSPRRADTGRHPLPDAGELAQWLGRHGVTGGKQVVAYDQAGGVYASRLWWMLRWLGHDAAAVLDGGWAAWTAGGHPVSDVVPEPESADFHTVVRDELWLTSDQLETALEEHRVRLVDARGAPRFRGETEPIDAKAGHIPGAVNLPFAGNLDEQGRFKDPRALRERFEAVTGDAPGEQVVHSCGSGVSACHNLLAMEIAGLPDSRLYVGSWSEWITDPRRPIAKGE
ncbi:MAG: sulfurtransferase [Arenicellales bacterium]